jgi:hypothetical protein
MAETLPSLMTIFTMQYLFVVREELVLVDWLE